MADHALRLGPYMSRTIADYRSFQPRKNMNFDLFSHSRCIPSLWLKLLLWGGKQCSRPKPWTGLHWTFQRRSRRVVVWCPSQDRAWTASRGSIPPGYGAAIVTWDPPKGNELGQKKKTALDIPGPHVHQSLPLSMAPCGAMIGQLLLHSTRIIDDFGENGTNSAFAAQEKIDLKALASWRGVGRHLQNPRSPAVQSSWSS